MKKKKTTVPVQGGTAHEKRAKLVRLMLEIASLDRAEYRKLRAEIWQSAARSHERLPSAGLREWTARAS